MQGPLDPYLEHPIRLYYADANLLKVTVQVLNDLGFSNLSLVKAHPLYYDALRQLYGELVSFEGLILVNPPLTSRRSGDPDYESLAIRDFCSTLSALCQANNKPATLINKCLPIFVANFDSATEARIVHDLLPFGVLGVCMLKPQLPTMPADVRMEERTQEIYNLLLEFFRQRDRKLGNFKDYRSAQELEQRRDQAAKLMEEVERLKAIREFDKAVALCRKVIEVLPEDPDAYIEGGRMLVRKRKFVAALQMFRDAEEVSQSSPTPNQEIAKLRVMQAQDYMMQRQSQGLDVDQEQVNQYLAEAAENFQTAADKASTIKVVDPKLQKEKQGEARGRIAEDILSLGLEESVGMDNPHLSSMMGLAESVIADLGSTPKALTPSQMIQMALMSFHKGEIGKAEKYLLKAAEDPESLSTACQKLNFVGTQLRRRGQIDRALTIYQKVIDLEPPFLGFVVFNLSVARQSKAVELAQEDPPAAARWESMSFGSLMEALFMEPHLPRDENFYFNSVLVPMLKVAKKLMTAVGQMVARMNDPTQERCQQACQYLEQMLAANRKKEALAMLFQLAGQLPAFFIQFSRYGTGQVYDFACGLRKILIKKPEPRMQKMGKVLGLLKPPAARSGLRAGAGLDIPALQPAIKALELGERIRAAGELAQAIYLEPKLLSRREIFEDQLLRELLLQMGHRVMSIRLEKFVPSPTERKVA